MSYNAEIWKLSAKVIHRLCICAYVQFHAR